MTERNAPTADAADGRPLPADLSGEVAVVTGGTRGIGRAVAEQVAAAGATTVATYHSDETAAERTAEALDSYTQPTAVRQFDVGDPEAVSEAFRSVREELGRPTLLVNNAGIMRNGPLVRMDDADWEAVLRTNLFGAFYCLRAAARGMLRTGGAVVNVASIAAHRGWPGQVNYAASKAGLLGLTRAAARELGERGIRTNAVSPGYVRTPLYDSFPDDAPYPDLDAIPQDRVCEPEEVAGTVLYLLSDAADYINGAVLRVDGGRLA